MPIDLSIAAVMADVLNRRGFLTHDDFSLGDDNAFGGYICSEEATLRAAGYNGGPLQSWSTSFRIPLAFTYGVWDSEDSPTTELLDAYTLATNLQLEESGLVARDLPRLLLGLKFQCLCGNITNVDPTTIPFRDRHLGIHQIPATCTCGRIMTTAIDVHLLFKGFP